MHVLQLTELSLSQVIKADGFSMTWCCLGQQLHSYYLGKKVGHEEYRAILCWYRFLFAGYFQTSLSKKKKYIVIEYCRWVAWSTGIKKWRAVSNLAFSLHSPSFYDLLVSVCLEGCLDTCLCFFAPALFFSMHFGFHSLGLHILNKGIPFAL